MTTRQKKGEKKESTTYSGAFLLGIGVGALVLSVAVFFLVPFFMPTIYELDTPLEATSTTSGGERTDTTEIAQESRATSTGPIPNYISTPDAVRAIYMTQCVVGTPTFRADLVKLIDETELNAVIIDIKDYTGKLAFDTDHPELKNSVSDQCGARDIKTFIEMLHSKGIYVMGRITVFQDPYYSLAHPELAVKFASPAGAVWKDHKGLSFVDVGAKPYWDYIITLSREAHALGFDELNYDYIRYPSDGPMKNIVFEWAGNKEKQVMLEEFYAYLHKEMKDPTKYPVGVTPPILSADLFGMVTTNYDDLNIGQVLERALPYFDYVAPMVYPSHYPAGFNGWKNPNTVPYELIKFVMGSAVRRTIASESPIETLGSSPIMKTVVVPPTSSTTATTTKEVLSGNYTKEVYDKDKMRPWIQDFDYGGDYDVAEVRAQIQATYDVGLDSWMLWAPSNRYTRGALKVES
ncbi:MAG: hypothetical protein UV60_C0020G0008 [Parcubacteria group bacterium GW2011_GWA2_43_11]|nr:MAG: hypothetical protein UV60_C0020G0008 [Parcubacteria group bacterium GW2011_GWA2_43_11]